MSTCTAQFTCTTYASQPMHHNLCITTYASRPVHHNLCITTYASRPLLLSAAGVYIVYLHVYPTPYSVQRIDFLKTSKRPSVDCDLPYRTVQTYVANAYQNLICFSEVKDHQNVGSSCFPSPLRHNTSSRGKGGVSVHH